MRLEEARLAFQRGQYAEAKRVALKLVKQGQQVADALQLLGYVEGRLGNLAGAARHLGDAVKLAPAAVESWYYLGMAERRLGRLAEAAAALQQALSLAPDFFEAAHDLGLVLHDLERYAEAAPCFERAASLRPASFEAHLNRGINFSKLRRYADEVACYEAALAIDGNEPRLLENLGQALVQLGAFARAVPVFERLLARAPEHDVARAALLQARMKLADWRGFDDELARVHAAIAAGRDGIAPFALTGLPSTPAQQLDVARRFSAPFTAAAAAAVARPPRSRGEGARIRIGYLSSDFRTHPVAVAMARSFELHDRARFEIVGLTIGSADDSALGRRIEAAFDRYVSLDGLLDAPAAQAIAALGIDILVDLNGYTEHARPGVLALRPAPLQMAYLGYPGTSGAPFIDYLVADAIVVPPAEQPFYSEKILYLPDSYQANDATRAVDAGTMTRADSGLADDAFVFCCFNDGYKLVPAMLALWMRVLRRTEHARSVLWLPSRSPEQQANLHAEAEQHGVAADRIVFAPYLELGRHLQRLPLADLFLDTLPYNAHGTASDALWAGLPLLTCTGNTFAGRVATSLLHAVGLPELVTSSPDEYEALAVELATDCARLQQLRKKLAALKPTAALFDSERFTRHLEAGFESAWARHSAGAVPEHIVVAPR